MHTEHENNNLDTINLVLVFSVLKKEYKLILFSTLLPAIIGFFYFINIPKEYTATGKIMPEISFKASNGMAGIYDLLRKFNNDTDLYNTEITSSELYAEILKTNDFYEYILSKKVKTIDNRKISFKTYYYDIMKNEKSNSVSNDRIKYYNATRDIQTRIVVTNTNKKNSVIVVNAKMPDPVVAADIANFTITYLTDFITKYRTEKSRKELHFIENLQKNLSKDSLQNKAISEEIHNSLAASKVKMKIKIQEDTPVFQILEKAQIPVISSNTSTNIALILLGGIGLFIGVFIAFLRNGNYKYLVNQSK